MKRKIRLSATNRAGKFKYVFDKPEKVIDFVKGWLKDPDIPYTVIIKERVNTMTEEIKIYKPTLVKEEALPLEKQELSYAKKLLEASKDGLIPVKLEEDVVIQRISHDLYAKPESGFRELFNNEARACRMAKKKYNTTARVEVTIVPSERKLVIHGIDSTGMSMDRFLNIFTVLGRSDNFDGSECGQFGMGRAALEFVPLRHLPFRHNDPRIVC